MSLARSSSRAEVNWLEMANQVSVKLLEAYEQLIVSQGSSISASEDNDLNTITKMRGFAIGQLKTVLESFSVPALASPTENETKMCNESVLRKCSDDFRLQPSTSSFFIPQNSLTIRSKALDLSNHIMLTAAKCVANKLSYEHGYLNNCLHTDLVDIPAETRITNIVLAGELLRELKELGLIRENLSSNVGNLEDLVKNRNARDKNLLEIIQGLKEETEAIEEDNDEEEFKQLKRMTKDIRGVLDSILDEAYPELKDDVKNIIQELYEAKDKEDPYVQVPKAVDVQAINLLLTAKIITLHETDTNLVRLMIY